MSKIINLGIADIKLSKSPEEAIRTTLGSCVGIVLYDVDKKIGAISHIMLSKDPTGKDSGKTPLKYGESALPILFQMMEENGSKLGQFGARIFGGASMFKGINSQFLQNIGESNIAVVKAFLESKKVPIIVEDVGGHDGRTITLYLDDGRVLLKKGGSEKYLYKVR